MEQVSVQDNFFELGGHSLLGVRMFARIEDAFNKRLPLATLLQAPTIEQLADLLDDQWEPSWSSLVPIRVEGSRTPFFCTHGVGAQVLCLRLLSGYLGEDQPFYGLQAQGLDGRTPPYRRIEDMAAHYIREIRGVQRHGPYLLGGFSTGGTVVFEMAQQLHAQGEQVGLVVLIDTYYPGPAKYIPTRSRFSAAVSPIVETTDRHLGRWTRMGTSQYAQWLRSEISGAVKRRIARGAKKLAPTMALHGWDVSEGLQRVIEANYAAEDSYLPRLYPGRLVLFWSSDPIEHRGTDTRLSWDDVAGGGLEVHVVPGNHNTMREEPHVRVLAAKLAECIQRALDV
jgi:thioesterase domain-containing protein